LITDWNVDFVGTSSRVDSDSLAGRNGFPSLTCAVYCDIEFKILVLVVCILEIMSNF